MRNISLFLFVVVIGISSVAEAQEWEVHEDHAVRGSNTGQERLLFNDTSAGGLEEFVDLCREACASGESDGDNGPCGGFVVNYADRDKTKPRFCAFKLVDSVPYGRQGKDTHLLVRANEWEQEVEGDGGNMQAGFESTMSEEEIQRRIDEAVSRATEDMVSKDDIWGLVDRQLGKVRGEVIEIRSEQKATIEEVRRLLAASQEHAEWHNEEVEMARRAIQEQKEEIEKKLEEARIREEEARLRQMEILKKSFERQGAIVVPKSCMNYMGVSVPCAEDE